VKALKLIDRIRIAEETLESRLEEEQRQIAEAHKRLDDEDRERGKQDGYNSIAVIDAKILAAVDDRRTTYDHPIGRGRSTSTLSPYEEGLSDYLIEHFRWEGLQVTLEKTPLYQGQKTVQAYDFILKFSWQHA